jgi:branched-subunit amino acid ABC-type transport system permease component
MVEKFTNFAQVALASLGMILTYHVVNFYGWSPYQALPLTTIVGALTGALLYILIVNPMKIQGSLEISLTFAFFAISITIGSILSLYSYWFLITKGFQTFGFILSNSDFYIDGTPGVVYVALALAMILSILVYFFMKYVKLGIAIRAVAENEDLARSLGINKFNMHLISWIIIGALTGLVGGILPLWTSTGIGFRDSFLVTVMAGSVLGGLESITGAIIGGIIVSYTQQSLALFLMKNIGISMGWLEPLIPAIFIICVLILYPNGIVEWISGPHNSRETLKVTFTNIRQAITYIIRQPESPQSTSLNFTGEESDGCEDKAIEKPLGKEKAESEQEKSR